MTDARDNWPTRKAEVEATRAAAVERAAAQRLEAEASEAEWNRIKDDNPPGDCEGRPDVATDVETAAKSSPHPPECPRSGRDGIVNGADPTYCSCERGSTAATKDRGYLDTLKRSIAKFGCAPWLLPDNAADKVFQGTKRRDHLVCKEVLSDALKKGPAGTEV
jgi:hypothetical protein